MKWKKFSENFPAHCSEGMLVYDGNNIFIGKVEHTLRGDRIRSEGYYCNDPECKWIYDDCCCYFKITKDSWWMSLPKKPNVEGYEE